MDADRFEALPPARQFTQEFMEAQRPLFEREMRAHWPQRCLDRYANGYRKANTNCQWLGWLSCAMAVKRNLRVEVR